MSSTTARPLVPKEPFFVIRQVSVAVLKYQTDRTGATEPESVIAICSQSALKGVATREEIESTGAGRLLTE